MDECRDPEPSDAAAYMEWDGETWYYNKRARYYYNRAGTLLHRAIWAKVHGPIADGHEVNHINRKRHDNRLVNLELLTISDHRRLSCEQRDDPAWTEGRSERTSRGLIEYWKGREPREVVCDQCGTTFLSTGMRALRCSDKCRAKAARTYSAGQRDRRRDGKPAM
jgi:hypothetical protein